MSELIPTTTLGEVMERFPGAQRALFRGYHIGGCSSCAFKADETLEQLCQRNNNLDVEAVIAHIRTSQEQDDKIWISPADLAELLKASPQARLLDVRTRPEFDAVKLSNAVFMSQPVMQEILSKWNREEVFVIYDHKGNQAMDAAAYFLGHGFPQVRCLRGGIDAWARQIDLEMQIYKMS